MTWLAGERSDSGVASAKKAHIEKTRKNIIANQVDSLLEDLEEYFCFFLHSKQMLIFSMCVFFALATPESERSPVNQVSNLFWLYFERL